MCALLFDSGWYFEEVFCFLPAVLRSPVHSFLQLPASKVMWSGILLVPVSCRGLSSEGPLPVGRHIVC